MEVHDPHRVEGGEQHEKKPVIKKVKDKVKRIKDKISKKHGHDDEHDHDDYGYSEEGEGLYEQDDDDVEKEINPEVHGAPIYESATTRNVASGRDENIGHGKISLALGDQARAATAVEDPWMPKKSATASDESQLLYPSAKGPAADPSGNLMTGSIPEAGIEQSHPSFQSSTVYKSANTGNLASVGDENIGHGKMSLGEVMASTAVKDPGMPKKSATSDETQLIYPSPKQSIGGDKVGTLGAISERVGEDPAAQKIMTEGTPTTGTAQNHSSSRSPTGRDEVGESPLLLSFQAMAVSDEPEGRQFITGTSPTGTHDQFSHSKAHQDRPGEQKSSTYTDKIASTATAAKDAAVSAAISAYETVSGAGSAMMGKGTAEAEKYDTKSRQTDQPGQPVSDKFSGSGTSIMGRGTAETEKYDTKNGQTGQPGHPVPDKGVSMKEYMAGKLRPGDEDRALSEVITDTIHQKQQQEEMNTSAGRAREASGKDGGGKGMVEKIKGAVTSWIGAGAHPSETTDTGIKEKQQSAHTVMPATTEKRMQ